MTDFNVTTSISPQLVQNAITSLEGGVTLRFRPEAWVNDYAVAVDPETPNTWQVPAALLLEHFGDEQGFHDKHQERDDLRHEGNAPKWIRDWSGPFEVELVDGWPDA